MPSIPFRFSLFHTFILYLLAQGSIGKPDDLVALFIMIIIVITVIITITIILSYYCYYHYYYYDYCYDYCKP